MITAIIGMLGYGKGQTDAEYMTSVVIETLVEIVIVILANYMMG